jgi:DNA-binding response OmpR family regulator
MHKVLILDDDQYILEMLTEVLTHEGYVVNAYTNTRDIVKLMSEKKPDLVIVDYLMNDINGGELCSAIKRHLPTAAIPVVIISAYERVLRSLGNYGCDYFIAKPLDIPDLLKRLKSLIKQNRV